MGMTNEKCRLIAKDFINKEFGGDIEKLKTFSFLKYWNGYTDCDSLDIVKVLYVLIWEDFEDLHYYQIGTNGIFGGDTINTFKTLFGLNESIIYDDKLIINERYHKALKFISENDNLYKKIDDFYKKIFSLGNFMFLPKLRPAGYQTINQYKGTNKNYMDYFDKFLLEYRLCELNDVNADATLKTLLEYNYKYLKSLNEFRETFFLDKYFENGSICEIFKTGRDSDIYENKEKYLEFIKLYINKVSEIIDFRIEKMIPIISSKIEEL